MKGRLEKESVADIDAILAAARRHLGLDGSRPWVLVSSRNKLGKKLFEVRENGRTLVGKIGTSVKSQGAFAALTQLWNAGLRPPSRYTVVEPVAYIESMNLLLQEKAPGRQLGTLIGSRDGEAGIRSAARWLACLHALEVPAPAAADTSDGLARCERELNGALRTYASRISGIVESIGNVPAPAEIRPSHGDFHPLNVFIADEGRVTIIDVDTYACRPREADVAYFLAQLQIQSESPAVPRLQKLFLREYRSASGATLDERWMCARMATAYIRSLHYDLCILRTRNLSIVDPLLTRAEESILHQIDV